MQLESAILKPLVSLDKNLVGTKLRVVGRLLAYDLSTAYALLLDDGIAILVDTTWCLEPRFSTWVKEPLCTLMVIGYLEASEVELPVPSIPGHAPAPQVDCYLVLRALLVMKAEDLDLTFWKRETEMVQDSVDKLGRQNV
ncbi:hypothetical protein BDN72DRAFT_833943 [Pluteus cervinus]|uniref:Uncharacterized protein n=1 Tax=Pluteus cervinus TaxID=181527 RepID=A0ACD3B8F4_9AGAR|nr:hypothetical protein BDN72DRAFT_833943 [Pluteus cervinus]